MPPKDLSRLQDISREKKLRLFLQGLKPEPDETILELGSARTSFFLRAVDSSQVIATDISATKLQSMRHPVMGCVLADATALPFKDNGVDIVFSNAVIEHVGEREQQQRFADEAQRAARRGYFITTPNKLFPFEFHFRLPLFQFVPKTIQRWLCNHVSLGWVKKGHWQDINLLTPGQFQSLFPTAQLEQQRITFFPETLICYEIHSHKSEGSH